MEGKNKTMHRLELVSVIRNVWVIKRNRIGLCQRSDYYFNKISDIVTHLNTIQILTESIQWMSVLVFYYRYVWKALEDFKGKIFTESIH